MARDVRAMALAISARRHEALQRLADIPMSDDTARIDRLEREVAELRRELQRIAQETAWVRTAANMAPLTAELYTDQAGDPPPKPYGDAR